MRTQSEKPVTKLRKTGLRCLGAWVLFGVCAGAAFIPAQVRGQTTPVQDAGRLQVSRPELEQLLKQLDEASRSTSYSAEFRQQAKSKAALVQQRLREGDFQVGDQIQLSIEQQPATALAVTTGRMLAIPSLGELSLEGVLRSELTDRVRTHVARFIQDPVVQTRSMVRVTILGFIARPGFHLVAAETPLPDALMLAGGPTPGAKLEDLRIQRARDRIWEGSLLRQAMAQGQTLDQMGLRSGDEITIPGQTESGSGRWTRYITIVSGLVLAVVAITRGR